MADLSGQIVSARIEEASVIKTAKIFGVSKSAVSNVKIAFEKEKKRSQQSTSLAESLRDRRASDFTSNC